MWRPISHHIGLCTYCLFLCNRWSLLWNQQQVLPITILLGLRLFCSLFKFLFELRSILYAGAWPYIYVVPCLRSPSLKSVHHAHNILILLLVEALNSTQNWLFDTIDGLLSLVNDQHIPLKIFLFLVPNFVEPEHTRNLSIEVIEVYIWYLTLWLIRAHIAVFFQ